MKMIFVNYNFKTGGISTSLYNLLKNINYTENLEIDVCLLNTIIDEQFSIPDNVNYFNPSFLLNIYYMPFNNIKNIRNIRNIYKIFTKCIIKIMCKIFGDRYVLNFIMRMIKINKKYDIAISFSNDIWIDGFVGGCNDFTLKCIKSDKKIGWVHNDPIELGFNYKICKDTYSKFDTIVNVSAACKEKFDKIIPEYITKSKVVYNMFLKDEIIKLSNDIEPYIGKYKFKIVTVARAHNQQKRLDRIIKIVKQLKKDEIDNFEWFILGDGPDLNNLRNEVKNQEISNEIKFLGNISNPYPYIKHADLFVLTSKYEAYPMVINEALLLETPVLTTNYAAAHEQINNGFNGIICENNSKALYENLKKIFLDKTIIESMNRNLKNSIIDNNTAINQFFDLLKN